MEKIMVVFSSTNIPESLVNKAITISKKKEAKLVILNVRDKKMSERVGNLTENMGFMGEKVVGMLKKDISQERCDVIFQKLSILESRAQENNIPYEIVVKKGPYIEGVYKTAEKKNITILICQKKDPKFRDDDFEVIRV